MAKRVSHSDAKKRYLAMLTDPAKGERRLSMEAAIKRTNKKFPKEKISTPQCGWSLVSKYRLDNAKAEDQWEAMLEEAAKLREKKGWTYPVICQNLKNQYGTDDVPSPATLSAYCRRMGVENGVPSNGTTNDPFVTVGDIKFFHCPQKGRVLIDMPKERAIDFLMKETKLEN